MRTATVWATYKIAVILLGALRFFQGVRMALSIGFVVALTIFTFGAAAPSVGLSLTSVITLAYEIVSAVVSITSILDEDTRLYSHPSIFLYMEVLR